MVVNPKLWRMQTHPGATGLSILSPPPQASEDSLWCVTRWVRVMCTYCVQACTQRRCLRGDSCDARALLFLHIKICCDPGLPATCPLPPPRLARRQVFLPPRMGRRVKGRQVSETLD